MTGAGATTPALSLADLAVTVAASHYRPSNVLLVAENAPLCCVEPYRRGHQSVIDKVCA
jgi:hypothetical protein